MGELLLQAEGTPLLARRAWGEGAVFFLALDPALAPLRDWGGALTVWQRLATTFPLPVAWPAQEFLNPYYARTAVESLPALALPTGLNLFFFLLVYVATIGPANYLVLRRFGRPEWGWVTTPAITLFFILLAYVTGFQLKGNDLIINQMSVAQGSATTGEARVESIVGLYSPRRATYDWTLTGDPLLHPLNDRPVNETQRLIQLGSANQWAQVRVDVGGVEAVIASTYVQGMKLSGQVRLTPQNDKRLGLEVDLRNDTGRRLEDVVLLTGNAALSLGSLEPGERYVGNPMLSPTSTPGSGSLTVPGVHVYGGNFSIESLIGPGDMYSDPRTYGRWQLLQALTSDPYSAISTPSQLSGLTDRVTVVAWATDVPFQASLDGRAFEMSGETVYFLHFPLTAALDVSAGPLELGFAWQRWRVLADNIGFYAQTLEDLFLPTGWVELEYQSWLSLTTVPISGLRVALQGDASLTPPHLAIWHWGEERWDMLPISIWGTYTLPDPTPYLGPNQAVRLRLENDTSTTTTVAQVHPIWVLASP